MNVVAEKAERDAQMLGDRLAGASWADLAERYALSPTGAKKAVKREARRRGGVRLPVAGKGGRMPNVVDVVERYVEFEKRLTAAGATATRATQLFVSDAEAADPISRYAVQVLIEKGYRCAIDDQGEAWFFAPGPLSDPGDVARNLN